MTTEEIKELPTEEKFQIMQAIWEDLRERFEKAAPTPGQEALLDRRLARIESGEAKVRDWDAVKLTLGRG